MSLAAFSAAVFPDDDATGLERRLVAAIFGRAAAADVRCVRATVVRRLLIYAPQMIDGQLGRLSIGGARLTGDLDLRGLRLDYAVEFEDTRFCGLQLADLRVVSLDIVGGSANAMTAGRLEVGHDLVIGRGFRCCGLRLPSAAIGGDLNLSGAQLGATDKGRSLNLDGARVGGRVYLRDGGPHDFVAEGHVSGQNARVAGGILCTSGEFRGDLILTRSQVRGEVSLKEAIIGGVLGMSAMDISSDVNLEGTRLAGTEASFVRTRIGGSLTFKTRRRTDDDPWIAVDLSQARIGFLDDQLDSWDRVRPRLNGMSLDGLTGPTDKDAIDRRIAWLGQQDGKDWSPRPYDQVRAALRGAGHESAARTVAIARERARADRGRPGRFWHAVSRAYGIVLGYGYRPFRFFWVSALIIAVFWVGAFFELDGCPRDTKGVCGAFATRKAEASDYSGLMYSADAFLPVDLGQTADWTPVRHRYGYLTASEAVLGWLMTGLLVGAVTGLLRRD
ncbi:MAG: hypothetical protein JWR63_640 [Conexibacter sp.]|nr:hypothetical protein [Conexibacter sp.]